MNEWWRQKLTQQVIDLEMEVKRLRAENLRLRLAIERTLADEESQPGGWGPDVTMVAVLKEALR